MRIEGPLLFEGFTKELKDHAKLVWLISSRKEDFPREEFAKNTTSGPEVDGPAVVTAAKENLGRTVVAGYDVWGVRRIRLIRYFASLKKTRMHVRILVGGVFMQAFANRGGDRTVVAEEPSLTEISIRANVSCIGHVTHRVKLKTATNTPCEPKITQSQHASVVDKDVRRL
jgi:hypothetical protein